MLNIVVVPVEYWSDEIEEYCQTPEYMLQLEHSLISISKWEMKWKKSFLSTPKKTIDETIDYVRCMTLTENVPNEVYLCLSVENINQVNKYIDDPMTATKFTMDDKSHSNEPLTSETIYCAMSMLQISWEAQYWHLNRLLTLIRMCNIKNQPPKKMTKSEIYQRNRELNEKRRKQYNTEG